MPSENKTPHIGLNQWEGNEYVKRQDFVDDNLIIDAEIKKLQNATEAAFQSGVDRKNQAIVNINSMGGSVDDSMQFSEVLDGILDIETDPSIGTTDAVASDILAPKKVVSEGKLLTGTMSNRGAVNQILAINGTYTIPQGYHSGSGKVTQSITTRGAATITPTITEQKILAGQYLSGDQTIAAVNVPADKVLTGTTIAGRAGTMPNRGAPATTLTTQGGRYNIPAGYFSGGYVMAQFPNLTPTNVRKGINIGGVMGTYAPKLSVKSHTENVVFNLNDEKTISITNIPGEVIAVGVDTNLQTPGNSSGTRIFKSMGLLFTAFPMTTQTLVFSDANGDGEGYWILGRVVITNINISGSTVNITLKDIAGVYRITSSSGWSVHVFYI